MNESVHRRLLTEIEAMKVEYGAVDVPQRLLDKAARIMTTEDVAETARLYEAARMSAQTHFLSEWSRGKIPGKVTQRSLEEDARRLEKLAGLLERKGDGEKAEQLRKKAEKVRSSTVEDVLRENQMNAATKKAAKKSEKKHINKKAMRRATAKAEKTKAAPKAKEPRVTVASTARDMVRAGKTNEEIWAVLQKDFGLDDSKKHYPAWYRNQVKHLDSKS